MFGPPKANILRPLALKATKGLGAKDALALYLAFQPLFWEKRQDLCLNWLRWVCASWARGNAFGTSMNNLSKEVTTEPEIWMSDKITNLAQETPNRNWCEWLNTLPRMQHDWHRLHGVNHTWRTPNRSVSNQIWKFIWWCNEQNWGTLDRARFARKRICNWKGYCARAIDSGPSKTSSKSC